MASPALGLVADLSRILAFVSLLVLIAGFWMGSTWITAGAIGVVLFTLLRVVTKSKLR
jgi:hypothetical protein